MNHRFGSRQGTVQDLRNVFISQFFFLEQKDGQALILRQFRQRLPDFILQFPPQQQVGRQRNPRVFILLLPELLMVLRVLFQGNGWMP